MRVKDMSLMLKVWIVLVQIVMIAVLLSSCNRQVSKNKNSTTVKEKKVTAVSDTGKVKTELVKEETTNYGGSLKAALHYPADTSKTAPSTLTDSIESSGIKVKGTLVKTSYGHKLLLEAEAKPVSKTDKTTLKKEESKGLTGTTTLESDSTSYSKQTEKESTAAGVSFFGWLFLILIVIISLYGMYRTFIR